MHDLAAGDAARHWFRTSGLCKRFSILVVQNARALAKGELVTTPVSDWSFTDKIQTVKIQTQTPFLLPYSVSIWCAVYKDNLYVTSYRGRRWVEDIIRDPHVRLKIGGQLFERTLSLVEHPNEKAAVLQAKGKKYPKWTVPPVSTATVFRVLPE